MVRLTVFIALLCVASPVLAQSKVYTNADLTSRAVTWTRTVTPEEWQGIVARRFIPPPDYPNEAIAYVIPSSPAGDVLPAPISYGASSYADRIWTDPLLAYQVQHPFGYGGFRTHRQHNAWQHVEGGARSPETQALRSAPPSVPPQPATVTNGIAGAASRTVRRP